MKDILHKYNFLLQILLRLDLKKFNKLVDYLHNLLSKGDFYKPQFVLASGTNNTLPVSMTYKAS